ncbi:MAG: VanW family protein [Patescibacteria group bacterium]
MPVKKRLGQTLLLLAVFLLLILGLTGYLSWKNNYHDRIYPGVKIGDLDLGGKDYASAKELIASRIKKIEADGLKFKYGEKLVTITSNVASFDADLSFPALTFNLDETVKEAFGADFNRTFGYYLLAKLKPQKQKSIAAIYTLDEAKVKSQLADNFKELEIATANAYFSLASGSRTDVKLKSNPEKLGKEINYDQAFEELRSNLDSLRDSPIVIKTRTKYPEVKQADLVGLEPEAQKIIGAGNLVLLFNEPGNGTSTEKIWTLKPERLITWVSVQKNNNQLEMVLDQEKIKQYLSLNASPEIDREVVRPRFEIKNGKVTSWQTGANGRQVDLDASAAKISQEFLNGQKEITLVIKEIANENLTDENNFNIKEIIGTGHSNFVGSPENRRKNIRVGADAVNGLLIKPGEEFSLVKTLGDVSQATGYFPELVIKGNKTVPEYGGGLCQIGTTVFRAALASGLPITARQSHSYRVSYYEPAGMDAAVYIPNPDVRFVNDTGNYILIQARINKNDIYFDFWGVKDGRIASTTKPNVYNIVKPEPTKLIETDTLAPGEKKCTEKAHNGADAYFDYTVIYPAGATTTPVQERRFKSHYVPWQEVCLIGVGTSTGATSTATSTNNSSATSTTKTNTSTTATSTNQ